LTPRELLRLHAEVKALQDQYGISYKDAAHRLYHGEIQKLSALTSSELKLSTVHDELDYAIGNAIEVEEEQIADTM
jgi:hypothetical protein